MTQPRVTDHRDIALEMLAAEEAALRARLVGVIADLACEILRWQHFADVQYRRRLEAERERDVARESYGRLAAEFRTFRTAVGKRRNEAA